jgi:hypothetical protein
MKKIISLFIISFLFITGCKPPQTFVRTMEPSWATIELRTEVTYDQAWMQIYDLLTKNFDIEVAQKENGYLRTGWLYTWTGEYSEYYRVRVTVKFAEDRKTVNVKSEAYYKDYIGFDTRLLQTLKTDIMGTVGRTTK